MNPVKYSYTLFASKELLAVLKIQISFSAQRLCFRTISSTDFEETSTNHKECKPPILLMKLRNTIMISDSECN